MNNPFAQLKKKREDHEEAVRKQKEDDDEARKSRVAYSDQYSDMVLSVLMSFRDAVAPTATVNRTSETIWTLGDMRHRHYKISLIFSPYSKVVRPCEFLVYRIGVHIEYDTVVAARESCKVNEASLIRALERVCVIGWI